MVDATVLLLRATDTSKSVAVNYANSNAIGASSWIAALLRGHIVPIYRGTFREPALQERPMRAAAAG